MTILPPLENLLFNHWLKRKCEILSSTTPRGTWEGPLARAIDRELDRLRPLRNPHLSVYL